MKKWNQLSRVLICLLAISCIVSVVEAKQATPKQQAKRIFDTSGVKGGLVVHIGCGDGKLTAALRPNDSYIVHGLDKSTKNVAKARKYIQSVGLYGNVSVDQWKGKRLPYIDNLINLVVLQSRRAGEVPRRELLRVLAPNGVACIKRGDSWTKIT